MRSDALAAGQLRLLLAAQTNTRDTWHEGSRSVSGPPEEASSIVMVPEFGIGLGRAFDLTLTLPYAWSSASNEAGEEEAAGFGDAATRLHWHTRLGGLAWTLSGGAYLPVGDLGTDELPTTATFTSGTIDPALGVSVSGPAPSGFGWHSAANLRWIVSDEESGSRRGSTVSGSLGLSRGLWTNVRGGLALVFLHRESDEMKEMMMKMEGHREDTGGDWLYLEPSIATPLLVRPRFALQTTLGARIPLLQDVVGTQLVESVSGYLALGMTWDTMSEMP